MQRATTNMAIVSLGFVFVCCADGVTQGDAVPSDTASGSSDDNPRAGEDNETTESDGSDSGQNSGESEDTDNTETSPGSGEPEEPEEHQQPDQNPGPSSQCAAAYDDVSSYGVVLPSDDEADIYYPFVSVAASERDNTDSAPRFPVVVLLQGANVARAHYSEYATQVARYGFIVIVADHTGGMLASFGMYTEMSVITDAIAFSEQENVRSGSPIEGRVDTTMSAILGHSFGGAAGLYAITGRCSVPFCTGSFERPVSLRAGVFYGTNLRPPIPSYGDVPVTENDGTAIMLVQGNLDTMADPDAAEETYNRISDPPKALVTLEGANHYGITNTNNPEGAAADQQEPTMSQQRALAEISRWTGIFLRAYVAQSTACIETLLDAAEDGSDTDAAVSVAAELF